MTASQSTEGNIAPSATVTASSESAQTGQTAAKAVDGVIDGCPGDYTKEWATLGQGAGAWLKLTWSSNYVVDKVVLYDRPNGNDQILSATLSFSDGSTVQVGALNNSGAGVEVDFTPENNQPNDHDRQYGQRLDAKCRVGRNSSIWNQK